MAAKRKQQKDSEPSAEGSPETPGALDLRDPTQLRPHPFIKDLHRWDPKSEAFHTFCDDVRLHGIQQPLLITPDGRVVDGEMRRQAALALQLPQVPCRLVVEEDAKLLAISSMLQRRHYTAGQRAYIIAPKIEEAWEVAKKRELAGPKGDVIGLGPEHWAEALGVSERYLRLAKALHELWEEYAAPIVIDDTHMTLREYFEPRIMDPDKPIGLGAAKAGIAGALESHAQRMQGKSHGGGKAKDYEQQLDLCSKAYKATFDRLGYYESWAAPRQEAWWKTLRVKASELAKKDPAQLERVADYYARTAKELKKEAELLKGGAA